MIDNLWCEVFDIARRNVVHEKDRIGTLKTDITNILADLRELGHQNDVATVFYPKIGSDMMWVSAEEKITRHFFIDGTIKARTVKAVLEIAKNPAAHRSVIISISNARPSVYLRDRQKHMDVLRGPNPMIISPFWSRDRLKRAVLGSRTKHGMGQTSTISK